LLARRTTQQYIGWILSTGGFQTTVLKAGYKSYRRWVLEELNKPRKFHVLGGRTGSGKTEILNAMAKYARIVDLEAEAHHKGSAFGHLGQPPQPGNETYENLIAEVLSAIPLHETIWLENESRNIGSVKLPDKIYEGIRDAFTVEIVLSPEERKKRIMNEYGIFPAELLADTTKRVRKRLGEVRLREAIGFLQEGNLEAWTELMLAYYDKMYNYGMDLREAGSVVRVDISPLTDADAAARKILDSVASFKERQTV
jgi:tRNA 2-selenouridine synthase